MVSQDKCSCSMIYSLFTKKEIGAIDTVNGRIKIKKKRKNNWTAGNTPVYEEKATGWSHCMTLCHYYRSGMTSHACLHSLCVCVCVLVYNHHSAINQVTVIRLPHVMWEIVLLINALRWSLFRPYGDNSQWRDVASRAAFQHHMHRSFWPGLSTAVAPS